MKILLAATGAQMFSGAARCLLDIAINLQQEHDVCVLIPEHGDLEKELQKNRIRYVFIKEWGCWWKYCGTNNDCVSKTKYILKRILNRISILRIKQLIKKECFDVAHVNAVTAYTAGKAAEEAHIPVIWHIRELMEEDLEIEFVDKKFALSILNKSTQMIAISECVKEKWKKLLKAPICVVYDGVEIANYYIEEKEKGDTITVLHYGRIVPGKGQLFYIKGAIQALEKIKTPCTFEFAGMIEDRAYYDECIREIEDNQCMDKIRYIGEISDIKSVLTRTNIVCVCSVFEGFGRVTVESMLGYCLVLAADTGASQEIINNNQCGILYRGGVQEDFVQKLVDAVENYDEYSKRINDGQKYALSMFAVERNTALIINIYKSEMGADALQQ